MKKITLLLLIFSLCSFNLVHKYYVSLTEIEFKQEQKSIQIIMSVFMDDIEMALNKNYKIDAQITNPNEVKNIDAYFYKYLQEHFSININGKQKKYTFIGKEYDGNIIYFYLEINNITALKSISIQNTMLIKCFDEQQNLIKIKNGNERKSLFLDSKNNKGLLKF